MGLLQPLCSRCSLTLAVKQTRLREQADLSAETEWIKAAEWSL